MDMGHPKEDLRFWENAQKTLKFRNDATMFIDDTEEVLYTAREYGIKYVVLKGIANTKAPRRENSDFLRVDMFKELFPDE